MAKELLKKKSSKTLLITALIHRSVSIEVSGECRQGNIIFVIPAGKKLTKNEVFQFAGLKVGDRWYESVKGEDTLVDRVVVSVPSRKTPGRTNFLISPLYKVIFN